MLGEQWTGRSQANFDSSGLDDPGIDICRHPLNTTSVEVLPPGFGRSAFNGFCSVRLRSGLNAKASGETDRQRANGYGDERATPFELTKPKMSQQLHVAVSDKPCFSELYTQGTMTSTLLLSRWIPNIGNRLQNSEGAGGSKSGHRFLTAVISG